MSAGPTWKRFAWITATLVVLPPLVMLCASSLGFFPWSKLNCWSNEVDLSTGRIRHTRHLFWFQISQSTEDSPVSRALGTNLGPEVWVFDSTFSPGVRNSPHYSFHGARLKMRMLESTWKYGGFTPEAKALTAGWLLRLWQNGGTDNAAENFLFELGDRNDFTDPDMVTRPDDLKAPPELIAR